MEPILIIGDLHLRIRPPEARRETDFQAVCLAKVRAVLTHAAENNAKWVLQPGDFFDSADPGKGLIAEVIRLLREYRKSAGITVIAIHGQHDLAYHAACASGRSALAIIEAAGLVELVGGRQFKFGNEWAISGADFGQEPPAPLTDDNRTTICMAHVMVGDRPIWPGQDLTGPDAYARAHPDFNLYVFGDYHYRYMTRVRGGLAINQGCLLRLNRTDLARGHTPEMRLVWNDVNGLQTSAVAVPCTTTDQAFLPDDRTADPQKVDLESLVTQLREGGKVGTSFRENLVQYHEAHKTPQAVRDAIEMALAAKE